MQASYLAHAAASLDDPIMIDWALRHYDALPAHSELRDTLGTLWFHDPTIEYWIKGNDLDTLKLLFVYLPEERFAAFAPIIAARWSEWPPTMAHSGAHILARIAPELAAETFSRYLESSQTWSIERAAAILSCLVKLPLNAALRLAERLIPLAWSKDEMCGLILREEAFAAALMLKQLETLPRLLDEIFSGTESRVQGAVNSLATCLFGHDSYADLFFWRRKAYSSTSFQQLACLFATDTPIAAMDEVLESADPLAPALSLLASCYDRSPESTLAWNLIQQSKTCQNGQHPEHLAALALAAVAASGERKHIDTASMPLAEVIGLLALDVHTNIHYAPLLERLRSFPRAETIPAMTRQLADSIDTYGGVTLARAMGDLAWPEFTEALLACMLDDHGDFVCEAAQKALIAIGESARDALIAQWETLDTSQQIFGESVITTVGGQPVTEFALHHSDALLRENLEFWCALALAAPDQRLLALLRHELPHDESLINETYYRLCRLLDASCPELDELRAKIMQRRSRQQERKAIFDSGTFPEPSHSLSLSLRCPACGTVRSYDVKGVVIGDTDKDQMLVADEIACLGCGAFPEFEFEPEAKMALIAEIFLAQAATRSGKSNAPQRLILDRVQLPDGSRKTFPSYYVSLQEKVRRNPEDWRSWFLLGKLLRRINRPNAALPCLRKAHSINPLSLDTIIDLAELLLNSGHLNDAFDLLDGAQKDSRRWQTMSERPIERRGEFALLFRHVRQLLGIAETAAAVTGAPGFVDKAPRTGRNEPCPCGSGKKFKKCCMS